MQINIPPNLYSQLEQRAKEKGYDNPEHYILYLLEQISDKLIQGKSKLADSQNTSSEEKQVRERLRKLGYLD